MLNQPQELFNLSYPQQAVETKMFESGRWLACFPTFVKFKHMPVALIVIALWISGLRSNLYPLRNPLRIRHPDSRMTTSATV